MEKWKGKEMVEDPSQIGLIKNVFYHKEKKKNDSQTFPTLKIFVLLLF